MSSAFEGAIFDVDGVLVDSPHEQAWRESLRELMEGDWREIRDRSSWSPERFTPEVYERVMSGKPRMSGARAALDYFKVPDVDGRAVAYANLKQSMVVDLINAGKFTAYPDALRFILAVKAAGIRVAAASSSKNARLFLRQIRLDEFADAQDLHYDFVTPGLSLLELFDADVSGRDFAHGEPDPEIFLAAAAELASPPHRCFVIEDAVSGIQAAKAGGMAALGIARADDADMLARADADLVVSSLDDVDVDSLIDGVLTRSRSRADASRPSGAAAGHPPRRRSGAPSCVATVEPPALRWHLTVGAAQLRPADCLGRTRRPRRPQHSGAPLRHSSCRPTRAGDALSLPQAASRSDATCLGCTRILRAERRPSMISSSA
jgi:beta-phosphoglucomutase